MRVRVGSLLIVSACWTGSAPPATTSPTPTPRVARKPAEPDRIYPHVESHPAPSMPSWHPPFPSPGMTSIGGEIGGQNTGVVVECVAASGAKFSTTIDATGHFVFVSIPPGNYTLTFREPNGATHVVTFGDARANDVPTIYMVGW